MIDNQVDQSTGTIRLKADFPNTELQLWPGQFVNVRLLLKTLQNVVVIPTAAVQRGPDGTFVYVVGGDSKVAARTITVAQQDDTQAVLAQGLTAGERVVTAGFARLKDGAEVNISDEGSPAAPAAGAPEANAGATSQANPEETAAINPATPAQGAAAAEGKRKRAAGAKHGHKRAAEGSQGATP